MILHDWNLEKKLQLIQVQLSMPCQPGGALMAIENIIDDGRRENVFGLLMSLNTHLLIEFGEAFDFSGADFPPMVAPRWASNGSRSFLSLARAAWPSLIK